jgi:ubiquinone/menaquinone biosynthesis C-methylase UbiE
MTSVDALADFPWPRPFENGPITTWTGHGFSIGGEKHRILVFDAEQSHWSPELTKLHEEEAGSDHPIDRASRQAAVSSLRQFRTAERPIVLDVGCSSGYLLQEIRESLPHAALIGSDYLAAPLMELAERMPDLPFLQFDLRRCPLPDACVDVVTALNVLEHIDRDEKALAEIFRILRPGGLAHVECPAGPHLFDVYDEYLMHHRRYRSSDLVKMARQTGFEILRATHLGFLVYPAFWFVKKRNRRLARRNPEGAAAQVKAHIRETGASTLMATLMRLELTLSKVMNFPFGIRSVLMLRKPAGQTDIGSRDGLRKQRVSAGGGMTNS